MLEVVGFDGGQLAKDRKDFLYLGLALKIVYSILKLSQLVTVYHHHHHLTRSDSRWGEPLGGNARRVDRLRKGVGSGFSSFLRPLGICICVATRIFRINPNPKF